MIRSTACVASSLFVATISLGIAHAEPEPEPRGAATAAAVATPAIASQGTLECHLEYVRFSPSFATAPLLSFRQPMATVVAQGGTVVSNGAYELFAWINPSPSTNLSFEIGVNQLPSATSALYVVLPPPVITSGFLFENGAPIAPTRINGVTYDHLRSYCSLTP